MVLLQHVNFMSQKMIVASGSDRLVNANMKVDMLQRPSPWGLSGCVQQLPGIASDFS